MRFSFLSGDVNWKDYGGTFISKKLNNGDFDYYLVVNFMNWEESTGEKGDSKYFLEICAVTPEQTKDKIRQAIECYGWDKEPSQADLVEALNSYGIRAILKTFYGNNADQLMKEARKECEMIESLFGFYMDKQQNWIGDTGWDFIKGNIGTKLEVK